MNAYTMLFVCAWGISCASCTSNTAGNEWLQVSISSETTVNRKPEHWLIAGCHNNDHGMQKDPKCACKLTSPTNKAGGVFPRCLPAYRGVLDARYVWIQWEGFSLSVWFQGRSRHEICTCAVCNYLTPPQPMHASEIDSISAVCLYGCKLSW